MRINEQGRSMIEMLGVLAIVGVLSVGGIAGYSKAMNKFKTNKLIDQVNMMSTNIRTLYSSQRNYTGLNNEIGIKTGIVPAEMFSPTDTNYVITNAFGGTVLVKASATSGDENGAYVIAVDGVPAASCISIVTTDWGGDSGSGLVAMYAKNDNGSVKEAFTELDAASPTASANIARPDDTTNGLPFTIVRANAACSNAGNAIIAWKYL